MVWGHVKELNREQGVTVLLATHFDEADYLCDRVAIMNEGKIVTSGTLQELKL